MDHPHDRPPQLDPFLYAPSTPSSPAPSSTMLGCRFGRVGRRLERGCCLCVTYFPVAFVYSLSIWSAWVTMRLCTLPADDPLVASSYKDSWRGPWCAYVAVVLSVLQLWSYTVAVRTSPGSTTNDHGYSTLPLHSPPASSFQQNQQHASSLTVKSNGGLRFCKKCQARKPDRAHHCSTCRRCVLKMDHHCPWLANCIGLRNAKAFVLFLIYTTLLALFCFAVSGTWVWNEIANEETYSSPGGGLDSAFLPVQLIILCVVAGIIGLVVGLFTAWHLLLACRGQTTIECMEKTRYQALGPSAAVVAVTNTFNNTFPGGGGSHRQPPRDEEQGHPFDGVEGAHDDDNDDDNDRSRLTYSDLERYRAQKRHEAYLDYEDSEKLPHAFDLGVRNNLLHLFGPRLWLWPFPFCTTTGDGWSWTPGPKWIAAREKLDRERAAQYARERAAGWGHGPAVAMPLRSPPSPSSQPSPPIVVTSSSPAAKQMPSRYRQTPARLMGMNAPSKADRVLGRNPQSYVDNNGDHDNMVAMQQLSVNGRTRHGDDDLFEDDDDDDIDVETDEEEAVLSSRLPPPTTQQQRPLSPLRARWMPDPASGLLRTASAAGGSSLSPTRAQHDGASSAAAATAGKEDDDDVD